jgi:rhodanese-related sulfurtransferase
MSATEVGGAVRTISPRAFFEMHAAGKPVELIDVRTPAEFGEVHASCARLVPLDELDPRAVMEGRASRGEPLYVICRSGNRAAKACAKFVAAGYPDVVNVEGGTLAWAEAGLPVVRGKEAMSLERQVRIAAGALVFVGSLLGGLVSPWWFLLSGFVGAGLVFAGITDTCGMAMVLAKMPWNRAGGPEGASCSR